MEGGVSPAFISVFGGTGGFSDARLRALELFEVGKRAGKPSQTLLRIPSRCLMLETLSSGAIWARANSPEIFLGERSSKILPQSKMPTKGLPWLVLGDLWAQGLPGIRDWGLSKGIQLTGIRE